MRSRIAVQLKDVIRSFPDFPKAGILFRDIMPLLKRPDVYRKVIEEIIDQWKGVPFDLVAGIEARGFIFGISLAQALDKGFIAIRKEGKLPGPTRKVEYSIEYGVATMEIQEDAVKRGDKVLIVDDLLATGGTAKAAAQLVEGLGGRVVGMAFVIELAGLRGREALKGYKVTSLVVYE